MTMTDLNPKVAAAVRAELVAIGSKASRLQHEQRRRRTIAVAIIAFAITVATTGAAVIVNSQPGSTTVNALSSVVTATRTGSASIDLGPVPAHAGAVIVELSCVSGSGTARVPTIPENPGIPAESAGILCPSRTRPIHLNDGLLPAAGITTITITADPGLTWKIWAQYAGSTTSPWAVNSHGQTYGVPNPHGDPDLRRAQGCNGKLGYVYTTDFDSLFDYTPGEYYINVFESDGTTVVGKWEIGPPSACNSTSPPMRLVPDAHRNR